MTIRRHMQSLALAAFLLGPEPALVHWATSHAHASPAATAERLVGMREGTSSLNQFLGVNSRRVRWCAAFVQSVFRSSGKRPPQTIAVRGWDSASVGPVVASPQRGDLAFWRHSHMGIVVSARAGTVCTVSGNRANRVARSCEPRRKFRRFRRPK